MAGILAGILPWQHFGNIRNRGGLIQQRGNGVEAGIEEVRVDVQCHRRRGVTEYPLHRFHVCADAEREARCGVPEVTITGNLATDPEVTQAGSISITKLRVIDADNIGVDLNRATAQIKRAPKAGE